MYDKSAIISVCRKYRYELRRIWNPRRGVVCFIMLNPSTANIDFNDPTIRRCMGFAATWGRGGIIVGNLFAYRTTMPRILRDVGDPIGPLNDEFLKAMTREAAITVCAWGNHGKYLKRDKTVLQLLSSPKCIAVNASGTPKHPLYARGYLEPRPFSPNKALHEKANRS